MSSAKCRPFCLGLTVEDSRRLHSLLSILVPVLACRIFGAKLVPEPVPTYCHYPPGIDTFELLNRNTSFRSRKWWRNQRLRNARHFVESSTYYEKLTSVPIHNSMWVGPQWEMVLYSNILPSERMRNTLMHTSVCVHIFRHGTSKCTHGQLYMACAYPHIYTNTYKCR